METILIKIKPHIFLSFCLLITLFSCQEFVEIEPPAYLQSGENVFNDKQAVEAVIVGIYGQLRSNILLTGTSHGLSNLLGNYADEIDFYGHYSLVDKDFFKNNLLASNTMVEEIWNRSYNQIYATNAIIEGVEASSYLSDEDKKIFLGEAKFLRALIHFYLYNLYGEIPYITTTDYNINKSVKRDNREMIYSSIIEDLKDAAYRLPSSNLSSEKVRADSRVARALLARVYLYHEQWESAIEMASLVIAESQWENDLSKVFFIESPSIIFQFMPQFQGMNTLEAQTFIFETAPPPTRALSQQLVNSFEDGDQRKMVWTGSVSDGNHTYYYPFKYKHRADEGNNVEYSVLLRLAEQYLIRAEARARAGDIAGAESDLNKIRTRAGLPNVTFTNMDQFILKVLKERKVELFTEHGHRFFDLKRTQNLDAVLGNSKPGWSSTNKVFPIPENELLRNANLQPQNPGY